MTARTFAAVCLLSVGAVGAGVLMRAQAPAAPAPGGRGRGAPPARQAAPPEAYPQRPAADPAVLERGKAIYSVNCAFCHGIDARGGDGGGPNLLRSQLVLGDERGELIAPVVQNGRPGTAMVPQKLTPEQIADVAAYIHSFRVGGYDITREPPPTILVGSASRGAAAFKARCAGCHSATGDLKGYGARTTDERDLQQGWLMPSSGSGRSGGVARNVPPTTVTVTLPSGERVQGRLLRIDDFVVTLEQANGLSKSFTRRGSVPKVEITDPLKPHKDLLPQYTDAEIHDITAYLHSLQ